MSWFKRLKEGIQTATKNKKETPDGLWHKCPSCGEMTTVKDLRDNLFICPKCDYHTRISSLDYFEIIFDGKYSRMFDNIISVDMLEFKDVKSYEDRLAEAYKKTNLNDSMSVAAGNVNKYPLVVACMDFGFIGGSMGSVVGEKISRSIDYCIEHRVPLMIISKSGGARMMESAFSLMQMAKTSAKLTLMAKNGIPYFSFMTDPTTGGVTASYAMLGDLNFAEPAALIGFAGPRVIKETIKRDLPEDFQTSEYLLEHGFLDFIVHRKDLKAKLADILSCFDLKKSESKELSEVQE
ncbi:MAG: acetyl-CoA carboxylase, carboxyltransferase subunit beta [Saprospiraceae bacterium]|jgi:acetyl-CoA carboxylase carboxyl transferase subunit beta|nr:acetyl-CoA carboxylase carboxyltransferase subunit beta [Saprospiraceae bacterium]